MKKKNNGFKLIRTKAYSPVIALMGGYKEKILPVDFGAPISTTSKPNGNIYGTSLVRKQSTTRKFLDKAKKPFVKGE